MDFTYYKYREFLESLLLNGFNFYPFINFLHQGDLLNNNLISILRHDVDIRPQHSLATAKLEHSLGVKGTYFFRIIPQTLKPNLIKEIADLGHEIGYHYEDMDLVHADKLDKHIELAYESFQKNLDILRKIVPINTICMHGSPRAKYDNKIIWTKYSYRDLGLMGEALLGH